MTIEDFKDVNDEFLEKVNECKKRLKKCDLIYNDYELLKKLFISKDKESIFIYNNNLSIDTISNLTKLDYDKEIYYNSLNNSLTTVPEINVTISLAKFKISISKSNCFSSMQAKVIEYYLDIITETELLNNFYKSLQRKFMNSFKNNVNNKLSATDIYLGKTISSFFDIREIVTDLKNDITNFIGIDYYKFNNYTNINDINPISLTNDDLYYIFENSDSLILSDSLIQRSIIFHINNNLESLDLNRIKTMFQRYSISDFIKIGIAVIFNDDDFNEIYKHQYSDNNSYDFFGRFKTNKRLYAYEIFEFDKNEVYKKFSDEMNIKYTFRSPDLFPGTNYKIEYQKNRYDNGYSSVSRLIKVMKNGKFKMKNIFVDNPKTFENIIISMNNNIDVFNDISLYDLQLKKTFTNEDFYEYIKPFLMKTDSN